MAPAPHKTVGSGPPVRHSLLAAGSCGELRPTVIGRTRDVGRDLQIAEVSVVVGGAGVLATAVGAAYAAAFEKRRRPPRCPGGLGTPAAVKRHTHKSEPASNETTRIPVIDTGCRRLRSQR
jgi:hypothetical protein